ncbi:Protein disulfide-isomerase like 2-2 [Picochlorum sp. SENEW3]|nr:Protein disulfide-isomerase like 2-2 [Picochlorum sp. SENEW3]
MDLERVFVYLCGILAISWAGGVQALYDPSGPVTDLTPTTFDSKIKQGVWMVEFYAPWCGHCQQLKPEYVKLAKALSGVVKVGAVNADEHGELAQRYQIKGFPTIKLMYSDASGKIKAVDYTGGRTASDMASWAMSQANKIVLGRLGQKSSSSSSRSGGSTSGFYAGSDVIDLTDSNFHSLVTKGHDMWFVEFYAPWCGHCKNLKPHWVGLAGSVRGKIKVGAVDCTQHQQTCSEYGVQGFPTIKFFGSNKDRPEDYNGPREEGDLVNFANDKWSRNQPPPEVRELTDANVWVDHCLGDGQDAAPKQICLVAFLPHILDSKADGRNRYISMLKEISLSYKERPFSWFWVQGAAQSNLEEALGVGGYGYPAFVALNPTKEKYASLKSGFEKEHVKEFMDNVRRGQEPVVSTSGDIKEIKTIDAWNGQDEEEIMEEEFSLEDLGL